MHNEIQEETKAQRNPYFSGPSPLTRDEIIKRKTPIFFFAGMNIMLLSVCRPEAEKKELRRKTCLKQ